jgi:putative transposase
MLKVLSIHASGYYVWLNQPLNKRAREDQYLLGFIKQLWLESGAVYGYRKI